MKVKVISRNPDEYIRGSKQEIEKVQRNLDPDLHPFEAAREYTRALNAAKLDRIFAKPFIASLDGHSDGVYCIKRNPTSLSCIASGSCDGVIKIWNLQKKACVKTLTAHSGFVRCVCFHNNGSKLLSVGDDKLIKHWNIRDEESTEPFSTIIHKNTIIGIDHHYTNSTFATCGEKVEIWDDVSSRPIRSFDWGVDTVHNIKFNPVEANIVAATGGDRSIMLYDIRGAQPLKKVTMKMNSNAASWNPIEAFIFSVANEDSNVYTFDMRRLKEPVNVHIDHVAAVLDVDYSPTGQEFVTGSFDKSIRIFPRDRSKSREVYHTSRMQRVFCVSFSGDAAYVLSGSDETNIRIWKANASEKLGLKTPREHRSLKYNEKLRDQYQHHSQIGRILRHRHEPSLIHKAKKERKIITDAIKRKEENIRLHCKEEDAPNVKERKKHIVRVDE